MPFRQKILNRLGLGRIKDDVKKHVQPGPSTGTDTAGITINNDERCLCTHQVNNGTYPRLTRLSDGSILCIFTSFEGGNRALGNTRVLTVAKSTDNGASFRECGVVIRRAQETDNPHILEVSPGVILAAFRNHDFGPPHPFTTFRITVYRSVDGGCTWDYASEAATKKPPWGIWEPFMRVGRQGEVQLYYSYEEAGNDQRSMLVKSFDHGSTWSQPQCVEGWKEKLRDGMIGIAPTRDNGRDALVMVYETNRHGAFSVEASVSYDDGASWHRRHEVYAARKPGHNAGCPQIASFEDGSMVVVFMTDEDAAKVDWVQNAAVKAVFSGPLQGGKPRWSKPMVVSPASSFWPGVLPLDGRTAMICYEYGGGPKAKTISRSG